MNVSFSVTSGRQVAIKSQSMLVYLYCGFVFVEFSTCGLETSKASQDRLLFRRQQLAVAGI